MRRIIEFQIVLFCFLMIFVVLVHCTDKNEIQSRETQTTSASDSLIVSLINNVIKLKDSNFFTSGIESSVRSVFSKPLTSAVYALSVVAGVVAMLAFYESPVSPMPVPPLPDPPVGRFPPEYPIWPPPQRDQMHTSDKKRVGIMNWGGGGAGGGNPAFNPNVGSAHHSHSGQFLFPQMGTNQKYSEMDSTGNAGAYQQLLNLIEKRNSKIGGKQNRISAGNGNGIGLPVPNISPQLYSSFSVESEPKPQNDSNKIQTLYSKFNPNDRHDSIEIINKFYNQNNLNNAFDKIKEFKGLKRTSNSDLLKDKLNYTLIASTDPNPNPNPNPNRKLNTKVGET